LIIIFIGTITNQKISAISKLINDMNIDTVKTRGMDKRVNMTPFIYNGCKFLSIKSLSFVACHHINVSNELVKITIKE